MRNVVIYHVYAEAQLKLSTINESEAQDYIDMYFEYNSIRCEKKTIAVASLDHSKASPK